MFGNIIRHVIFGIILPTADTFSDVNFAISAFSTQNYRIGVVMILPVTANLVFNFYLWKTTDFDTGKEKRFSWMLVMLNVWPQYQVLKLIASILKNDENWKERQRKIKMELSYIEPFIEAMPQYFIALGVFTMLLTRDVDKSHGRLHRIDWNIRSQSLFNLFLQDSTSIWQRKDDNEIIKVFGKDTLGISNTFMFPLSLALSFVSGVKSVIDYLQNGPISISSENKVCKILLFIAKMIYVKTEFLNKILLCFYISLTNSTLDGDKVDGAVIIGVIFITSVIIPVLWVIVPIARYLGIKKFIALFFRNPQLLTLPLITDFVFGPLNGYRKCDCCGCCTCCCSIGCCCCWCYCCKKCRFEEGHEITISKEMSWVKMIYSSFLILIYCIPFFIFSAHSKEVFLAYSVLVVVGRITFIIILHAGKLFHVLTLDTS